MRPKRQLWRWIIAAVLLAGVGTLGRPAIHLSLAALRDRSDRPTPPPGYLGDASGLSQTRVAEVWPIPPDASAAERQLVTLLRRARSQQSPISVAGARHTMGGHTLAPDGIVIDMRPFRAMELDLARGILHLQAGALWSDVLPVLNAKGQSVAVMQSNNSFTVGGSVSVNCHGWQANRPPIASTVESFRILRADGSIVRCSRTENAELFSLALGGYGLFCVILDVDLRVVPNEAYRPERFVMPANQLVAAWSERVSNALSASSN